MAASLLDGPVARLQKLQKPSLPWSFVARQLVKLLRNYSTGLSFEIAADETQSAWRACRLNEGQQRHVLTGTVVNVVKGCPEVWLLALEDTCTVAVFAHTSFVRRVRAGALVSFYDRDVIHVGDKGSTDCFEFVEKFLAENVANGNEGLDSTAQADRAEDDSKNTPTKLQLEEQDNSQSPVDISKFPSKTGQLAVTPSQGARADNPASQVQQVVLPTRQMIFDLNSMDHSLIGLTEAPEAFTLLRVWNERSLAPSWIFAHVVEVGEPSSNVVRLQDSPFDDTSDQPSVLCTFSEELSLMTEVLKPGYEVLLQNPAVQPTGSSFEVFCTSETVCFYRQMSPANMLSTQFGVPVTPPGSGPNRPSKRRRVDPDLAKSNTPVRMKDIACLVDPTSQAELVVLSMVIAEPEKVEPYVTLVPCEEDIVVRVIGLEMADIASKVKVGDEVLFSHMEWALPMSSLGSQTPAGWIAGGIQVLSTMPGFLHSSFARNVSSISDLYSVRLSSDRAKTVSAFKSGTFVVHVRITRVAVFKLTKQVVIEVIDHTRAKKSLWSEPVNGRNPLREIEANANNRLQRADVVTREIITRGRCLEELLRVTDVDTFWDQDPEESVVSNLERLKAGTWLMIVACSPFLPDQRPELCCCAPGVA